MTIYTESFALGYDAAGARRFDVYTVPMDGVTVLRDLLLTSDGATGTRQLGALIVTPGGADCWLVAYPATDQSVTRHWEGRQVLPPGSVVSVFSDSSDISYALTGYRLGL